jgi:hypothetical protein
MHAGYVERFLERHARQQTGHALREHGLAGTWRAGQKEVVTTRKHWSSSGSDPALMGRFT